jgi:hypothetical protein
VSNGGSSVAAKVAALIALANFARAKLCFERAGLGVEWESTLRLLFSRHQGALYTSAYRK